ncbi:hypothetical protein IJM86_01170 [bacterium]|nr:hypothetical protein [bacterium]
MGASFDIFATQTEANRAYNMMNMQTEYENYNKIKKHKRSKKECSKWGIGNKKIFRRWCKKYKYEPV